MSVEDNLRPPVKQIRDHARDHAMDLITWIGGPIAKKFANICPALRDSYEKREQIWKEYIADVLYDLESRIGIVESLTLIESEAFYTVFTRATLAALRTHQKEKHIALSNAITNFFYCHDMMKEDMQLIFIKLIDTLEPSHLRLLNFINRNASEFHSLDSYKFLLDEYLCQSNLEVTPDQFQLLMQDLLQNNLLKISSSVVDFSSIYEPNRLIAETSDTENLSRLRVTDVGKCFLEFITYEPQ